MSVEKEYDDIKLQLINEILELCPILKKNRDLLINKLLHRPISNTLERIIYNEQKYYWDNKGNIFDTDVNLVGVYKTSKTNNLTYGESITTTAYYKQDIDIMFTNLMTSIKKYKIKLHI
jgi:hypothetical protein